MWFTGFYTNDMQTVKSEDEHDYISFLLDWPVCMGTIKNIDIRTNVSSLARKSLVKAERFIRVMLGSWSLMLLTILTIVYFYKPV